jgi:hypothetical protein
MAIVGYLFVVYLKKKHLDSRMDITHIEVSGILNGFRLVF